MALKLSVGIKERIRKKSQFTIKLRLHFNLSQVSLHHQLLSYQTQLTTFLYYIILSTVITTEDADARIRQFQFLR